MIEEEKTMPVDFSKVEIEILTRVNSEGKIDDMENWRKTFPDLPFEEVDDMFTGKEIDWEKRTTKEKAFYVAYMRDPQVAVVDYTMEVEELRLRNREDNSEVIWCMWMDGCFVGEELEEEAIKALLWYLTDDELGRKYIEDMDLGDVKLVKFEAMVAPL